MTSTADLLVDAFERVRDVVHRAVDGLDSDQLAVRVDSEANSIAWLVWHLTRVQDDHVAGVADVEQVWLSDGWCDRFGLPFPRGAIGYGQSNPNPAPGPKFLSTAVDADTAANIDDLFDVARLFRLSGADALAILSQVHAAVSRWRAVAGRHGLGKADQDAMVPAFERPQAERAAEVLTG